MVVNIGQYIRIIEQHIRKEKFGKSPPSLYEPVRYIMELGGKRLRPLLTMMSYSMYKGNVENVLPYAIAVEAFHNFTLMHDDIMDNAPLRRGKPTVHKNWNVNTAILSGDVMLVKVYDLFSKLPPHQLSEVIPVFNKCAAEVCEGQQWDMEFEKMPHVTEAQYIQMIKLKTAVLLGFSLELGGILAGAPTEDCKRLQSFGINIGIGFQLKDDLLDAYADPKKFGKLVGGDIIANKKTFLLIKAMEQARGKQRSELRKWLQAKKFKKQEKVASIKAIYNDLQIPALTEKKLNQYFKKGFNDLSKLSCSPDRKQMLKSFAEELIQRQS